MSNNVRSPTAADWRLIGREVDCNIDFSRKILCPSTGRYDCVPINGLNRIDSWENLKSVISN